MNGRFQSCFGLLIFAVASQPCVAQTKLDELAKAPAGKKISYGTEPLQYGELILP